jgi:hypothetical protein
MISLYRVSLILHLENCYRSPTLQVMYPSVRVCIHLIQIHEERI